jgi:hypothetical protein
MFLYGNDGDIVDFFPDTSKIYKITLVPRNKKIVVNNML